MFAICLVLGLSFGLVVGLGRYARNPWLHWPATAFVEFFRNTPVLVQILWFYFALPILLPFDDQPAGRGVARHLAQFGGLLGGDLSRRHPVDRAAASGTARGRSGMGWGQAMRRIILPQALKRMTPALTNRAIEIFKMSTLASAVAYVELLQQGKLIASLNFNRSRPTRRWR